MNLTFGEGRGGSDTEILNKGMGKKGFYLKTGKHSIFVIIREIKKKIHICWIPQIDDFI